MARRTKAQQKARTNIFTAIGWLVWKLIGFFGRLARKVVGLAARAVWSALGRLGVPIARRKVAESRAPR
ncbi:hypothetical protein [Aeromicrobium sp. Leaf350]|uniref:hypothetical protein n=1 Tax=Aeromicrobium sp. Leaf350 TaxID=2876565 RepID=UPI001E5F0796|nr:hypothetical protein [Aeromicrobium sp. Leaf350]